MTAIPASETVAPMTEARRPFALMPVRVFLGALGALLVGYMFMGRGFAHLGLRPIYVGEAVLFIGLVATAYAYFRGAIRPRPMLILWLLIGFMVIGVARTVPYLGVYGVDALRDAVLWGYAVFALMVYALFDRVLTLDAARLYGWVIPVFAIWLPICFNVFVALSGSIDSNELGSNVPLIFFKSGDMSVHVVGAIAFLVLVASEIRGWRSFLWRAAITVPLLWAAFVAGSTNRGGLVAVVFGLMAIAVLAVILRRGRNWLPVIAAPVALALVLAAGGLLTQLSSVVATLTTPTPTPVPTAASPAPEPSGEATEEGSLLANPGFELGVGDGGEISGWQASGGPYSIVADGGYGGGSYLSLQNAGEPFTAALISGTFAFPEGEAVLAVSVRGRAITGSPTLEIYVNWFDREGAQLANQYVSKLSTDGESTWQEASGVAMAPPEATEAQIVLFEATGGGATIGLDEAIAEPGDLTDRSLVTNPGFDLGAVEDGRISGWQAWGGAYGIVADGGYRGGKYASLENLGGPFTAALTSGMFEFPEGQEDLAVSVRGRAITETPTVEVYVNWLDGEGEVLANHYVSKLVTGRDSGWQETSGVVTAPPDATHAQVVLFEATGGGATIGLDEVIAEAGDFPDAVITLPPGEGRPASIAQLIENITSIFSDVEDEGLEGTKRFRVRWWTAIVNYTVFGEHFWTGKGFGINLADADGFQPNADGSLRAPHNSHITALARMGVPGFVMWVALQVAFGLALLRSVLAHRASGDLRIAAVGGWLLAYWVAMMVNTSFDPYIEGPQGGIWFWCVIGLGLVVIGLDPRRLDPRRSEA